MTKKQWVKRITKDCQEIGTYKPAFDKVIETLSTILEIRDQTLEQYDGNPLVVHVNSHGEANASKNPALMLYESYNALALSYWRDLGLTPAGLKKIDAESVKNKKRSSFAEALSQLEL